MSLHTSVSTREGKTPVCDVRYHGLIVTMLRDLSPDFFFVSTSSPILLISNHFSATPLNTLNVIELLFHNIPLPSEMIY